jgi:hypothetical protein
MLKKTLKILLGLALVPFCIGFSWQLAVTLVTVRYLPVVPYYFFAGGLLYLGIHFLFRKPIFSYVVGHELTHALFAMLFGGTVKSFHASDKGGRVTITKSNFIITLAPYFFPLYTFVALVLYWIARTADAYRGTIDVLIFLSGATFAFHLVLTFIFLMTDQNDIQEQGAAFSYPLIYLFNVAFAALLINLLLVENPDFLRFIIGGIMKSTYMLSLLIQKVHAIL